MKIYLLATLAVFLLCGAAPQPHLLPAKPVLGRPVTLVVPLLGPEWELAGLPDLSPFELLAPPQRIANELHLHLMPMRAGARQLPALPLRHNGKAAGSTQLLKVAVSDDLPAAAVPAPLKDSLATRGEQMLRWGSAFSGLGLLLLFSLWRYFYSRPPRPLPLSELPPQQLLEALTERLSTTPHGKEECRQALLERIAALRFGPLAPTTDELKTILADVLAYCRGES